MTEVVLDASVLVKWFKTAGEQHVIAARRLRGRFERGELLIVVPPLLFLELLNLAARRWAWGEVRLEQLATRLEALGLEVQEPPLTRVAHWSSLGLTAYDACYVALAEARRVALVTADDRILAVAQGIARSIAAEP